MILTYRKLLTVCLLMFASANVAAQAAWKWQPRQSESFALAAKQLKNLGALKEPTGRESAALIQIEISATHPVNVAYVAPSTVVELIEDFKVIKHIQAPCKFVGVLKLKANCSIGVEAFPVVLVIQDANQAWLTTMAGGQK